jgi:peptidoglycan/LPS O-acetylase OafA/YrhL
MMRDRGSQDPRPSEKLPVTAPDTRVFHTLDALRGIAAIGVVIFHVGEEFLPLATPGGYLAVDLFFMMSGVVLSHAYEGRFRAGMGTREFMRLRLIRLYPLYLLGLLAGIAVTLASMAGRNSMGWEASSLLPAILLALLFLPNLSGRPVDSLFPLNIPCWSLFLEVVVNLLFVLAWPLLTVRRLVITVLWTGTAMVAATLHVGHADQGATVATLAAGVARVIFGFFVGVLIARHIQPGRRCESNWGVIAIMGVVLVAIVGWPEAGMARAIWDVSCMLVVFPLVVLWGTRVDPGEWLGRVATFLGVTSYAVYVLHSPLLSVMNSATPFMVRLTGRSIEAPWLAIAVVVGLLAGAWLVDRYFDTPVRLLLGKVIPRVRAARVAQPKT